MAPGLDRPENSVRPQGPEVPPTPEGAAKGMPPEEQARFARLARQLNEAAGFLELGLPEKTLAILEKLGDVGPFAPGAALLKAEALRLQERFAEAGACFELAARYIPPPFDRPAYMAASACYREAGDIDRAVNLLGWARGALPPFKRIVFQGVVIPRIRRAGTSGPREDHPGGPQDNHSPPQNFFSN
jgi:tetratricopeptide (TPR) repeat protein